MRLQIKMLLGISVIVALFLFIFSEVVTNITGRSFAQLDYERSVRNVIRIRETLDQYQGTLKEKVSDWGMWDDTYNYLKDGDQEFVVKNLKPAGFQNLNLQHMVFFNPDKSVKKAFSVDLDTGEYASQTATLLTEFFNSYPIPDISDHEAISGYLEFSQVTVIFAARRVYRNDGSGPSTGILLFGQNLDERLVARISQATKSSVSLEAPDTIIPFQPVTMFTAVGQPSDMKYYYTDSDQSMAVVPIFSYLQDKIGLMILKTSRDSEKLSRINQMHFLVSLSVVGVVICVVVLILNYLFILKKLHKISKVVHNITRLNNLDSRIVMTGSDELTDFSRDLNAMFESLKKASSFLATKDQLEAIVSERTTELAQSKQILETQLAEKERLNQVMIGREIKMIELKKEIEELKNAAHKSG